MTTIQDMFAAVDAAAQTHFGWCAAHEYEDPEPHSQLCRSRFGLDFSASRERDNDDVTEISVELSGSWADVEHGHPVPTAAIGFNGGFGEREMQPWKLTPIAFLLLAAQARAEGDAARAQAFEDAANAAIVEHYTATAKAEPEPEYVVAEPARHWSQGPFSHVMGSHPEDGIITWDEYEVRQSIDAGIPQFVIQHTTPGRYKVVKADPMDSGKPVGGIEYDDFDEAKKVRDRLNARERAAALVEQSAAYDIDDEVTPTVGPFVGQQGIVDELDLGDDDAPFRVRFEHVDGEPIAWFNALQLEPAGGAR